MKLDSLFVRLPYRFDPGPILEQVAALDSAAWQPHPRGWEGHQVLPLISAEGSDDLARLEGAMTATAWLEGLPAMRHLLAALDTVLGRAMLVRADAGREAGRLVDAGPYWHRRVRVFMPLDCATEVSWQCGDQTLSIPPGQAWLLDGWSGYQHKTPTEQDLLYLVVDTVGSASFWSTVNSSDRPLEAGRTDAMSPRQIAFKGDPKPLETEFLPSSRVMSPWEQESLINGVLTELKGVLPADAPHLSRLEAVLNQFMRQWQGIHARHGEDEAGDAAYKQTLEQLVAQAAMFAGAWKLPNGLDAAELLYQTVVIGALKDAEGKPVMILPPGAKQRQAGQAAEQTHQTNQTDPAQSPLRSVHTKSLPQLLQAVASSVLVSTYQAGKLVILRENQGKLNTHFRVYNRPMGLAADRVRMALGTAISVEYYRNMPDVARKLEPPGRHDSAFLPRRAHITGNIDIHEMAWAKDELWLVNTRFSCLCTLDNEHSFVPRWRPRFISGYAAEDRCHLNGLEVVDGKPKYVTALGTADTAGGWRENKAGGGVLIDIDSNEFICRGLSMPHSPRWYQDKLWVLESGNGTLATVDLNSGQLETVAELPGFTRGLDFIGPYAFVGLSQVRESAVFAGISLTERVSERSCGVWVVDIRSGQIVAFLKFEDAVQEVFAVSVLEGIRFPDVLGGADPHVGVSYVLPDEAIKEVTGDGAPGQQSGEQVTG